MQVLLISYKAWTNITFVRKKNIYEVCKWLNCHFVFETGVKLFDYKDFVLETNAFNVDCGWGNAANWCLEYYREKAKGIMSILIWTFTYPYAETDPEACTLHDIQIKTFINKIITCIQFYMSSISMREHLQKEFLNNFHFLPFRLGWM